METVSADDAKACSVAPRRWDSFAWSAALCGVIFTILAAWTWRGWCDPFVDFGRELYLASRVGEGAALYRDVAHLNGPLSVWFNALLFRVFGASLMTLAIANLALLAAMSVMVLVFLRRIASAGAALIATVTMLLLCGFIQLSSIGNYNFVTPYSHELTHGVILSVGLLLAIECWLRRRNAFSAAVCGVLLGLIVLTKVEVAVAASLATMVAAAMDRRLSRIAILCTTAIIVVGGAWGAIAMQIGSHDAWQAFLSPWRHAVDPRVRSIPLYAASLGTDTPGRYLAMTTWWSVVFFLGLTIGFLLDDRGLRRRTWLASVIGTVIVIGLSFATPADAFWSAPQAMNLAMLVIGVNVATRWWRQRQDTRWTMRLVLCVFAIALLAKIALHPRVAHYGFALALPATLVIVIALVDWLPGWASKCHGKPSPFLRSAGLVILALVTISHLRIAWRLEREKTAWIGVGANAFRATPAQKTRFDAIVTAIGSAESVATIPDGAMLNVQVRTSSSTPFTNLQPLDVLVFGHDRVERAFAEHPPAVVVLLPISRIDYGTDTLDDYLPNVARQLADDYIASPIDGADATIYRRR